MLQQYYKLIVFCSPWYLMNEDGSFIQNFCKLFLKAAETSADVEESNLRQLFVTVVKAVRFFMSFYDIKATQYLNLIDVSIDF